MIKRSPDWLQGRVVRRQFMLPTRLPKEMVFKVAETRDEFEQALGLVYEAYLEQGLISSNQQAQRFTKYHAFPYSTVIVGKWKDEVVATLMVIMDSPLGLPADAGWDLEGIRGLGDRVAEISSLAIKRGWRRRRGFILMPLVKFLYEYAVKYAGVDHFVAITNQSARFFYRHILRFQDLDQRLAGKSYQFVKTDRPWGMTLDLRRARKEFRRASVGKSDSRNIFRFFCERRFEGFQFPKREFFKSFDSVLDAKVLQMFFCQGPLSASDISDEDREFLRSVYHFNEFRKVIPPGLIPGRLDRKHPRFPVRIKGFLRGSTEAVSLPIEILEVSQRGLVIRAHEIQLSGFKMRLCFPISDQKTVELEASPVWMKAGGLIGLKISRITDGTWGSYIRYLEGSLRNRPKAE
ncbi:MAG: hypothetical protein KDD43_13175, partial [Bdellovibrionales bacterium]|nr:hypothetical protein [Bdellovibrionales bacterium]